ncbi:MAG: SH3 domain-containing protein [Actinobacteria bacterium]|nr:SH3 domain-containing protein [Actinomycetota bacterium]
MDKLPTRMRVTTSRVSDHIDDVRLRAGDSIAVGHRNQQYPEFVWCATEDGHHGWAPEECLEMQSPSSAVALRDYAAAHLTVSRGEIVETLEQVGSWVFCRNASGRSGWVRSDALEEVPKD